MSITIETTPIRVKKLGHLVLLVRNLEASVEFYTKLFGLKISDRIGDQMVFLRAGEDHHDLALSRLPEDSPDRDDLPRYTRPGLEHFSYYVDSVEEMKRAIEVAKALNIEIERGLGQHGPGDNWFLVFKDPDGNNVEIYTGMEQITEDKDREAQTWPRSIDAFDRHHFKYFVVEPPAAVVAQKKGENS